MFFVVVFFRPRPGTIGTAREQENKNAGHLRVHVVVLVLIYKANALPPISPASTRGDEPIRNRNPVTAPLFRNIFCVFFLFFKMRNCAGRGVELFEPRVKVGRSAVSERPSFRLWGFLFF